MNIKHFIDNQLMKMGLLRSQDWSPVNVVLIISTGRTGTKFFAEFFRGIPGVMPFHEPHPDFLRYALRYAEGGITPEQAARYIEKNRRALCREVKRKQAGTYIESNNRLFPLLKPFRQVFPNSKIIYIVRDGRDYVRSGMSRPWYTENDRQPRLRADMLGDDPYAQDWDRMSRFEKICWRWQKKNSFIYNDIQELENTITVTFESIFTDSGKKGLYEISDFIGIDNEYTEKFAREKADTKVNANPVLSIPRWPEWDDKMKQNFDRIASEYMKLHYDYKGMT